MAARQLISLWDSIPFKLIFSGITAITLEVVGENTLGIKVLTILAFFDILTGSIKGVLQGEFSSWKLIKKALTLVMYWSAFLAAYHVSRLTNSLIWAKDVLVIYFSITELVSILENVHATGVPIPEKVKKALDKQLDNNSDD